MEVEFLGVRGSYPVTGKDFVKFGGHTSCVVIKGRETILILDAGTGIIKLKKAKNLPEKGEYHLFFSHYHLDHIQGLFFADFLFKDDSKVSFYGPTIFNYRLEDVMEILSLPIFSPYSFFELPKKIQLIELRDRESLSVGEFKVKAMKSHAHPKGGVMIYSVEKEGKKVVYATDTEGYVGSDTKLINFAEGADLLIHDAQYMMKEYTQGCQGFGHSTPEMAAEVARRARVRKLVLFHHDPEHSDEEIKEIEKKAREIFPDTIAAYEGLIEIL